jgi:hypothetical protein
LQRSKFRDLAEIIEYLQDNNKNSTSYRKSNEFLANVEVTAGSFSFSWSYGRQKLEGCKHELIKMMKLQLEIQF